MQTRCYVKAHRVNKGVSISADEVDDNQVEHDVGEEEVGEGSFRGDGQEFCFVLRVDLDTQANWKQWKQARNERAPLGKFRKVCKGVRTWNDVQ